MKKIRLGIIGCGLMMKSHIAGIGAIDNVELTACVDIILDHAKELAEDYPGAKVCTDWKDIVDDVDAVLIALPHDLHYECGVFFARHKKHVLMEKPLCNTEEECKSLIDICDEEGVVLMCAYPLRYRPGILKMKELVDSGEFGKIMQISLWTEQLTKLPEGHWLTTARLGGGQFFSHGCHYVDLLMWFLGNPVQGTHFGTKIGTPWLRKEGTSVATFKFENGALGYHGATWGSRGTHLAWNMQIITEKGLLEYDRTRIKLYNQNHEHIPNAPVNMQKYEVIWEDAVEAGKQTQFEIAHFVDCIVNGKKPNTDGRDAMKSLQVIWKMYDAEKAGVIADLTDIKVR